MRQTIIAARGHGQTTMASATAKAIQEAQRQQERDERIARMESNLQGLEQKLETLAQQIAQLVELLKTAAPPSAEKGTKSK